MPSYYYLVCAYDKIYTEHGICVLCSVGVYHKVYVFVFFRVVHVCDGHIVHVCDVHIVHVCDVHTVHVNDFI